MATVACPTCGRKVEYSPSNRWRPFCSERCKTNDLGAWASNQYVIGGNPQEGASSDQPDDARADGASSAPPPRQ